MRATMMPKCHFCSERRHKACISASNLPQVIFDRPLSPSAGRTWYHHKRDGFNGQRLLKTAAQSMVVVAHAFNPSTRRRQEAGGRRQRGRGRQISEFKASLVYKVSSRLYRETLSPPPKKNKANKQTKTNKQNMLLRHSFTKLSQYQCPKTRGSCFTSQGPQREASDVGVLSCSLTPESLFHASLGLGKRNKAIWKLAILYKY
jgi:hypothetical protein